MVPGEIPFSNVVDVYDAETSTWGILQHPGTCGFRQAVSLHSSGQSVTGLLDW